MRSLAQSVAPDATVSTPKNKVSWGRQDLAMAADVRLTATDWRVHAVLIASERKGFVQMGTRQIAKFAGTDFQGVARSIRNLAQYGILSVLEGGKGKRSFYRLLSPVFSSAAPATTAVAKAWHEPERHACAKCGLVRKVNSFCMCWPCKRFLDDSALIRALRVEFPGISHADACLRLHIGLQTKRALRLRILFAAVA